MTIATDIASVQRIRDEWLAMRSSTVSSIFTDPDRFLAVTEAIGDGVKPHVAAFHSDGEAQALLVGRTSRRRIECRLGYKPIKTPLLNSLEIEYGGVIGADDDGRIQEALLGALKALMRDGLTDYISVNHLPLEHTFCAKARAEFGEGIIGRVEPHWVCDFENASWNATMSKFSAKNRENMRRQDRQLVKRFEGKVEVRVFSKVTEIEEFVQKAQRIAERTYQYQMAVGFADKPTWRAILKVEAQMGRLRAYLLECGGIPVAFEIGTIYGQICNLEATGYLPEYRQFSPGTVLLHRVFQDLWAKGVRIVDYGFGDAEYKRSYGTRSWEEVNLSIYSGRLRPRVAWAINRSTTLATELATRMLRSGGVLNNAKRKWRDYLQRTRVDRSKGNP